MARFLRLALLACLIGGPGFVQAQPSFRCSGELTRTERAICADQGVSKLDRDMAALYHAEFSRRDAQGKRRLRAEQSAWLKWRGSCQADRECLTRRYTQRISDLRPALQQLEIIGTLDIGAVGGLVQPGTGASADQVVARRIGVDQFGNQRYEIVYGDGRIEWRFINGGGFGTDYPDGRREQYALNQVVVDGFPALPGGYAEWGATVETQLLGVLDQLLPEADRAEYRTLHGGKNYSERVKTHIDVIGFLVAE